MQCKEIMSHNVQWILPSETVASAAQIMAFHNLGLLPVCSDDGNALGVVTDRDIALRVIGKERLAAQTVVEDVMTTPVHSVAPDCPVNRAGELMTRTGVSRLLVLDELGHLVGLVSVNDLLAHTPGHNALATARSLYARKRSDHATGHPQHASKPTPEFFRGDRAPDGLATPPANDGPLTQNFARIEAGQVVHGGTNELKEFPA